jgi:hypothetical protein
MRRAAIRCPSALHLPRDQSSGGGCQPNLCSNFWGLGCSQESVGRPQHVYHTGFWRRHQPSGCQWLHSDCHWLIPTTGFDPSQGAVKALLSQPDAMSRTDESPPEFSLEGLQLPAWSVAQTARGYNSTWPLKVQGSARPMYTPTSNERQAL